MIDVKASVHFFKSLRSQRFHRWAASLFVPAKTIKSPNFTLGKGEKQACVYRRPSLFYHIQDNI